MPALRLRSRGERTSHVLDGSCALGIVDAVSARASQRASAMPPHQRRPIGALRICDVAQAKRCAFELAQPRSAVWLGSPARRRRAEPRQPLRRRPRRSAQPGRARSAQSSERLTSCTRGPLRCSATRASTRRRDTAPRPRARDRRRSSLRPRETTSTRTICRGRRDTTVACGPRCLPPARAGLPGSVPALPAR
jgi:hypothetical protein